MNNSIMDQIAAMPEPAPPQVLIKANIFDRTLTILSAIVVGGVVGLALAKILGF